MSRVGAVIVTYNHAAALERLLRDLGGQTRKPDDVIVIDNASEDGTADVISRSPIPVYSVRNDTNRGSAGGYRKGIEIAAGRNDYIWCLDDDVALERGTLAALLDALGRIGPGCALGALKCADRVSDELHLRPMDAFGWRGTLIPASVVQKVGLPDERYFLYGEDHAYSSRIVRSGYRLFSVPGSVIANQVRTPQRSIVFLGRAIMFYDDAARLYYAFRNELYVHFKYGRLGRLVRLLFRAIVISWALYVSGTKNDRERFGAIWRGIGHGMVGLLGRNARYAL